VQSSCVCLILMGLDKDESYKINCGRDSKCAHGKEREKSVRRKKKEWHQATRTYKHACILRLFILFERERVAEKKSESSGCVVKGLLVFCLELGIYT